MRRILPALVLAALVVGLSPTLLSANGVAWTAMHASNRFDWQQPLPQGNPLSVLDFVDDNTGWAVGNNGTVIKTIDGGFHWTNQGPILPQGSSDKTSNVWDVCFVDATHGWIAADSAVYRTTNGGTTWSPTSAWLTDSEGDPITYLSADFADTSNGWMIGSYQVFHTTNGGTTVGIQAIPAGFDPVFVDAASSTHAYIGGISGVSEGYLRTIDGGSTWEQRYFTGTINAAASADAIAAVDGSKVFMATGGNVFKTTNGGSSWTTMTVGNAFGDPVLYLNVVDGDASGSTVYARTDNGAVYRTANGGDVWVLVNALYDGWRFDAPSSGTLFAINGSRVERSTNSGAGFSPCDAANTRNAYNAIDFTTETTGYAVTDADFARTADGGTTWNVEDFSGRGVSMKDIFFLKSNPMVGWIVGTPTTFGLPTVLKTIDGGANWASQVETTMVTAQTVCFSDADNGWAVDPFWGRFWRSTDGGESWVQVPHVGYHRDVDFVDASNGWIAFSSSDGADTLLHTTNSGSTWTTQTAGNSGGEIIAIDFLDANHGWAAHSFDGLYKTTNGGVNWSPVALWAYAPDFNIKDISFSTPMDGWVVGEQMSSTLIPHYRHDFAAHTTDGGVTWDFVNDPDGADKGSTGTAVHLNAVETLGSDAWLVGAGGSILKTRQRPVATVTSRWANLTEWNRSCVVTGTLTLRGAPASGKRIELWSSASTSGFTKTSAFATTALNGSFSISVTPRSKTYYRVRFAGDADTLASNPSNSVRVMPSPYVGNPIAPATMYRTKYRTVYGYVKPRHPSGAYVIRIYKWRKTSSGAWKSYGYSWASASAYNSTTSKYSRSIKLPYTGQWRLRAYHPADSGQAAEWSSGFDYVRVR